MKLQDIPQKYNNIAVISTGGGNDIKSSLAKIKFLTSHGATVDLFGVLSPGASHTFDSVGEQVINSLSKHMKRYVGASKTQISFDDTYVPTIIKNLDLPVRDCYELSIKYGNEILSKEFNSFANENGYDLLLGIDVGGDILGRIGKDKKVISPLMDHNILHLLGESPLDSLLLEFGIGTDGELQDIDGVLQDVENHEALLQEGTYGENDTIIKDLTEIHDYLKKNNQRLGNTIPRTVETFTSKKSIYTKHKVNQRFGEKSRSAYHPVLLDKKYFKKYYLIDSKKLHSARKGTSTKGFPTLKDQYIHYKTLSQDRKTEMDGLIDSASNSLMLCISHHFEGDMRKDIIQAGIDEYNTNDVNSLYMYNKDVPDNTTKPLGQHKLINRSISKFKNQRK